MRRNNLGYLGFLGLLGLLGLVTGDFWVFGYFGFFGFFSMLKRSVNDERIDRNIYRSCRNAFAFYAVIATVSTAYVVSTTTFAAMPLFAALLSQGVTIFGLSYMYYDGKGD